MADGKYSQLNLWQKAAVRHAYPASFVLNLLGLLWAGYFLWLHRLGWAVLCFAMMVTVGPLLASLDKSYLIQARSQLNAFQKLLVYHVHPVNLILHLLGLASYVYGAWMHEGLFILGAISFVLLGHIFPWLFHKKQERLFTLMIDEDVSDRGEE